MAGGTTVGASGAGSVTLPDNNRVEIIDFGRASKKLKANLVRAIALTPYRADLTGPLTKARFNAFLKSPILTLLSAAGPQLAAQALAAQLVNVTPVARQAFAALFGPKVPFVSVVRVVLTRRVSLAPHEAKFLDGLAKGFKSTGIPLAYVERSDVKTSFVKHFQKLGVLTVKDVNSLLGQRRLAQILTGQITTQRAVDAVKLTRTSALTDSHGSAGVTPWLLLALLFGGVGFAASGAVRHRGRRASV